MSKYTHRKRAGRISYTSLGLANGLILGAFVGILVGNPIIFAGGGLVLGLAVGSALDQRSKENSDKNQSG